MVAVPEIVAQLRGRLRGLEKPRRGLGEKPLSTGWPPLDRLLPGGGLRRGSLVEWLAAEAGSGAALLAWQAAQQAAHEGGAIVVLDRRREVYPPALAAWGVALERVIFVQPESARDEGWAWDQALRCPGVAAVWGWVERVDDSLFRRWQLAAEASGCLGLLLRPGAARAGPTWADVRWWVEPQTAAADRRVRIELLRCRQAGSGSVELVLDEWSGQLGDPAPKRDHAPIRAIGAGPSLQSQSPFPSKLEQEERHVTHPRPLAAQLARATARPRPTGTGGARPRAV
jgi:protein ImuA